MSRLNKKGWVLWKKKHDGNFSKDGLVSYTDHIPIYPSKNKANKAIDKTDTRSLGPRKIRMELGEE